MTIRSTDRVDRFSIFLLGIARPGGVSEISDEPDSAARPLAVADSRLRKNRSTRLRRRYVPFDRAMDADAAWVGTSASQQPLQDRPRSNRQYGGCRLLTTTARKSKRPAAATAEARPGLSARRRDGYLSEGGTWRPRKTERPAQSRVVTVKESHYSISVGEKSARQETGQRCYAGVASNRRYGKSAVRPRGIMESVIGDHVRMSPAPSASAFHLAANSS